MNASEIRAHLTRLQMERIDAEELRAPDSLAEDAGGSTGPEDRERLTQAIAAVGAVSRTLEELSSDTLRRWRDRFPTSVSGAANGGGNEAGSGTGGTAAGR